MLDSKSFNSLSKKQLNKISGGGKSTEKDDEEVGIDSAEGEGEDEGYGEDNF